MKAESFQKSNLCLGIAFIVSDVSTPVQKRALNKASLLLLAFDENSTASEISPL